MLGFIDCIMWLVRAWSILTFMVTLTNCGTHSIILPDWRVSLPPSIYRYLSDFISSYIGENVAHTYFVLFEFVFSGWWVVNMCLCCLYFKYGVHVLLKSFRGFKWAAINLVIQVSDTFTCTYVCLSLAVAAAQLSAPPFLSESVIVLISAAAGSLVYMVLIWMFCVCRGHKKAGRCT